MYTLPEETIRNELSSSETMLWSGEPRQGMFLRGSDAFLIPFSLMWGGFAIFWEVGVVKSNAPPFFALWGIPFVAIGLYMIFGRFWVDARQRAKTVYGITSERIIIVSGLFSTQTKSLNLRTLTDVSLTEKANGIGTITFGPVPFWQSMYGPSWPGTGAQSVPQFEMIADAKRVYEIIRNAQRESQLRASAISAE
jgi:hypothetical protein